MNKRIAELMELNKAVDVICAEVDKTNKVKREQIKGNYRDRWNAMFDDLDEIIPVVHSITKAGDRHYLWRQRMTWDNGVSNPVGTPKGGFRRQSKATIDEVLEDYVEIGGGHD